MPLNVPQQLMINQARSDYEIFIHLRGVDVCHRLHYLQMSTEKLAKVYFWRNMSFPGFSHHTFEPFLRSLEARPDFHQMFGYRDRRRFDLQKEPIFDLATRLQNLAPASGNDGRNPEYPWPPKHPSISPLSFKYPEWQDWSETTPGRRLKGFVENLLTHYLVYFP